MVGKDVNISFWTLIDPSLGDLFKGGVHGAAATLILIIVGIAVFTVGYAFFHGNKILKTLRMAQMPIDDVEREGVAHTRNIILQRAQQQSEPVRSAWFNFDQSLVVDRHGVYETLPASEFFNERQFAHKIVGNRLFHLAPTALTTFGLIGTFIGLVIGLQSLNLEATADELQVGINQLIMGAAVGFRTSLWGVSLSLIVNAIIRGTERGIVKKIHALQNKIDQVFVSKSPEQALSDMASDTAESREALQVLHEKIGNVMQEAVKSVSDDTTHAVTTAINSSLVPVMKELAEHARDQSQEVFKQVSEALTAEFRTAGASVAEQLAHSSQAMRSTLDYMSDKLAEHSDKHLDEMNQIRSESWAQLREFGATIEQQLDLVNNRFPEIIQAMGDTASTITSATSGIDGAVIKLSDAATGLDGTAVKISDSLGNAVESVHSLASQTPDFASGLTQQQDKLIELAESSISAARSLEAVSTNFRAELSGISKAQQEFLEELERQLEVHSRAMAGWLQTYGEQVQKQTQYRMDEWNDHTERFSSQMVATVQSLGNVIEEWPLIDSANGRGNVEDVGSNV